VVRAAGADLEHEVLAGGDPVRSGEALHRQRHLLTWDDGCHGLDAVTQLRLDAAEADGLALAGAVDAPQRGDEVDDLPRAEGGVELHGRQSEQDRVRGERLRRELDGAAAHLGEHRVRHGAERRRSRLRRRCRAQRHRRRVGEELQPRRRLGPRLRGRDLLAEGLGVQDLGDVDRVAPVEERLDRRPGVDVALREVLVEPRVQRQLELLEPARGMGDALAVTVAAAAVGRAVVPLPDPHLVALAVEPVAEEPLGRGDARRVVVHAMDHEHRDVGRDRACSPVALGVPPLVLTGHLTGAGRERGLRRAAPRRLDVAAEVVAERAGR
jgi:hypothetical protein